MSSVSQYGVTTLTGRIPDMARCKPRSGGGYERGLLVPLSGPETDVEIEHGFASADPVEDLARRIARTSDPASAIASLLGQAYVRVFDEQVSVEQRHDASTGLVLAATRHVRSNSTLVIAAAVAAGPHLIRHLRAAAESALAKMSTSTGWFHRTVMPSCD